VDWPTALNYVVDGVKRVKAEFGVAGIGALGHAGSTVEELHLLAKLVRALGSESIDHRTRHSDFTHTGGVRWLGTTIASLTRLDRALVVGSFLRKDHPLLAQRLRQAVRSGAEIHNVNAVADDWLISVATQLTVAPSGWVKALADIAHCVAKAQGGSAPFAGDCTPQAEAIAASLLNGTSKAVLLGNAAAQHPQASTLLALAGWIAKATGATVGYLGESGNNVGAQLVGALPGAGGLNAGQMLSQPMKALFLLGVEPELDAANAAAARAALGASGLVVALTPFRNAAADVADVLLPVSPFTETAGTFVNAEGRVQSFQGVARPLGETRPAWKVLRVLGDMLGLPGFAQQSADEVLAEALGDLATLPARLNNEAELPAALPSEAVSGFERIADVPIYATDSLVRRALSLQLTADARAPQAALPAQLWADLGLAAGDKVRVSQGGADAVLAARLDKTLAPTAVRVPAGHVLTAGLGASFGAITVAKA
jgi:NADH-quinone oxidoreductase subunit G